VELRSVFITNPPEITPRASSRSPGSRDFASAMPRCRIKHANFIINHGQASAADLERLIAHVRTRSSACMAVALRPECGSWERRKPCASATNRASCAASPTPASFGHVAVLFGGDSSEREISLLSGNAVLMRSKRRAWTRTPSIRALGAVGSDRAPLRPRLDRAARSRR